MRLGHCTTMTKPSSPVLVVPCVPVKPSDSAIGSDTLRSGLRVFKALISEQYGTRRGQKERNGEKSNVTWASESFTRRMVYAAVKSINLKDVSLSLNINSLLKRT